MWNAADRYYGLENQSTSGNKRGRELMTRDFLLIACPPITPSNLDNKCIS
jgi:hypothetical protein